MCVHMSRLLIVARLMFVFEDGVGGLAGESARLYITETHVGSLCRSAAQQ